MCWDFIDENKTKQNKTQEGGLSVKNYTTLSQDVFTSNENR